MTDHVLNPCPTCGTRFDFPLTGCMTFVAESLVATGGNCPKCGTRVVVDVLDEPMRAAVDLVSAAQTEEEAGAIGVVDLPLSVRSRAILLRQGIQTFGDLLRITRPELARLFQDQPTCLEEIDELLGGRIP